MGWLRECPGNETIWYAVVRAAELTSPDRKASADLIAAARTAVPNSVWIETVRARALGTVEAAEAAVRFDPSHIPAQVALAAAYDRAGDRESALRILRPLRDLHRIAGGPLLLARVAWALGDWQLAADSAKRETDHEGSFIEPVSSIVFVGEARLLEGEARLKLGQADKALTAFHEAEVWSSLDAMERLRSPTPALERAMEARLKKSHLDEEFRCRILEYLGALRLRSGDVKAGVHLLTKALFLPEYSCGFDALQSGGPEVRKVLEKLRASPRLTARERERIDEVLKPQLPRPLAEPGN
jgi:tetratricopeptide (TPR) repeat protein